MSKKHSAWDVAEAVMGVSRRVLMYGKPGTGKTYHAVNAGKPEKVYQITMTDETPAAEIRGHYIMKGGEYVWSDGPGTRAWREGARFVINEIDRASEDALSFLYVLMDDPEFAETTLPTGEVVKPHSDFSIVATMNGMPEDLPEALQDRFPVDIEITDVHPEAIAQLPEDLREPAINTTLARDGGRRLSIRSWLEYAKLRDTFDDPTMAAQAIFGDGAEQALMALAIAENASAPQTMSGVDLSLPGNVLLINDLKYVAARIVKNDSKWQDPQYFSEWLTTRIQSAGESQTFLATFEFRDDLTKLTFDEQKKVFTPDHVILVRKDGVKQSLTDFVLHDDLAELSYSS